ncbi:MAG: alpha-ketoacid dehydrogenase subunit beta [DPANN group archaeon]|nr:alpha-ketoacid dehydrogenase subunit beta [DPANN group archaeon]
MTKMHMVKALNNALQQEMEADASIMVLGEDVGVNGGVFRVTEGLQEAFGKDRVVDTPLAESAIVGAAIGLAINGMRPVAEMQFSGFSYQAFAQIKQHAARIRQRSEGTFSAPLVIRAPSSGGIRALEHHSESPEAFFTHCQGLKVVMPSGPYDAKGLLIASIRDPDPVIFLEPKKIYRAFKEEVPEEPYTVPLGKAKVVSQGEQLTIISWGSMLKLCQKALLQLDQESGIELIDLRTIWPFDIDTIITSVKKTGRALIVHEAPRTAGMGAEIAARIQEQCLLHLEAPVIRVTGFDVPFPQFALEEHYLPNVTRILDGIQKVLEF